MVITIFFQHLKICSRKLGESQRLLPGDASGNNIWRLCGFESFVAIANPQTTHAGREMTHLAWLAKSATDRKMLSLVVVTSFRLCHINSMKKAILW